MFKPKVRACISAYNHESFIERAVTRVHFQDLPNMGAKVLILENFSAHACSAWMVAK